MTASPCVRTLIFGLATTALAEPHGPDVVWLDRLGMGADGPSFESLERMGPRKYLDAQLADPRPLPLAIQARIDALSTTGLRPLELMRHRDSLAHLVDSAKGMDAKAAAQKTLDQWKSQVFAESVKRNLWRAMYSPDGLRERMVWFWGNHFSVFSGKDEGSILVGDYEERALRPNALGRFRDLVLATLRHPAMLAYLDNAQNAAGHANENYARELLELHTLGVDGGYTHQVVMALAKVLTGVGINWQRTPDKGKLPMGLVRDEGFEFNPRRHDSTGVVLLGKPVAGTGFDEIRQAVDILCRHPSTARHVATRIATCLLGKTPPPALVQAMSKTFAKTDGDIGAVVRTFFESAESHSPGALKDPRRFVVGALRQAYEGKVLTNLNPAANWIRQLDEPLFGRPTPDGYPLTESGWSSEGQMVKRFEIARAIGSGPAGLFEVDSGAPAPGRGFPLYQRPAFWKWREPLLGDSTKSVLNQASSAQEWNLLWISSPEAMRD